MSVRRAKPGQLSRYTAAKCSDDERRKNKVNPSRRMSGVRGRRMEIRIRSRRDGVQRRMAHRSLAGHERCRNPSVCSGFVADVRVSTDCRCNYTRSVLALFASLSLLYNSGAFPLGFQRRIFGTTASEFRLEQVEYCRHCCADNRRLPRHSWFAICRGSTTSGLGPSEHSRVRHGKPCGA